MTSSADTIENDAARLLRGVTRLGRRLRAGRSEVQISPSKLSVLGSLLTAGPMAATDLAAREGIQPQSLTRLLADIEARGLIERSRSATDGRRQLIALTAAGTTVLKAEMRRRHAWLAAAMAALTPADRRQLALAGDLLQRLAGDEAGAKPLDHRVATTAEATAWPQETATG